MSLPKFIRENLESVIGEWESFALTLLPAAGEIDSLALRDHARSILLAIAADVQTIQSDEQSIEKSHGNRDASGVAETAATIHGAMRQKTGFNISQLAAEYRALRSSVLRSWRAVRVHHPSDEMMAARFHEAIDEALAESIARYSAEVERGQNLFVGMVGHDIRTPLAAIAMSTEILSRQAKTPIQAQRSLERISRSVSTIDSMVMELLKFARIGLGSDMPLNRSASDLYLICTLAIDDLVAAHPNASIDLDAPKAFPGSWDAHRMGQVLRNLLSNAISYGDPNKKIVVRLRDAEGNAVLSISNEGQGIPKDALGKIFEPLTRLAPINGNGGSREATHLGLGLYIVREIVTAHGGTVWVESFGGLTAFNVLIPHYLASHPGDLASMH